MSRNCSFPRCAGKATGVKCHDGCSLEKTKAKPKKAISKISAKGKLKRIERLTLLPTDGAMYLEIWQERPHVDFETGLPIYGELKTLYFHHVLPKRPIEYPQYRHCKWNIVILAWDTHTNADNNRCKKVNEYKELLLKLHEKGILETIDSNTQFLTAKLLN